MRTTTLLKAKEYSFKIEIRAATFSLVSKGTVSTQLTWQGVCLMKINLKGAALIKQKPVFY